MIGIQSTVKRNVHVYRYIYTSRDVTRYQLNNAIGVHQKYNLSKNLQNYKQCHHDITVERGRQLGIE